MGVFKLKYFIIVAVILFLTGCGATYNIEIKDNKVYENATLSVPKSSLNDKDKNGFTNKEAVDYTFESLHDKYNNQEETKTRSFSLEKIDDENNYGLKYSNTLKLSNYEDSPLLEQCYDSVSIVNLNNKFSLRTSNVFNCFDYYEYLDNVDIKVISEYKLTNNADEVEGNTYIWHVNKNNYHNKSIYFTIDSFKASGSDTLANIVLIGVGILAIGAGIWVYFKVKNSNN